MSADKRRRARVQGGWASGPSKPTKTATSRPNASAPGWLGKTVDNPTKDKFVYHGQEEPLREKPPVRVLEIRLFYNLIDPKDASWMFDTLFHELLWRQKTNQRYGKTFLQPRMTAWFGDRSYRYSGITEDANTKWHPLLLTLRQRLEEVTGMTFNSVLCNLYRDHKDSVDWHADDEPLLGINPTIASLSFGDARNFELRRKPPPEESGDYTYMQHVRIPLPSASLCIMEGATQHDWQHRIPKEYHDREPRINLTYRVIHPE